MLNFWNRFIYLTRYICMFASDTGVLRNKKDYLDCKCRSRLECSCRSCPGWHYECILFQFQYNKGSHIFKCNMSINNLQVWKKQVTFYATGICLFVLHPNSLHLIRRKNGIIKRQKRQFFCIPPSKCILWFSSEFFSWNNSDSSPQPMILCWTCLIFP